MKKNGVWRSDSERIKNEVGYHDGNQNRFAIFLHDWLRKYEEIVASLISHILLLFVRYLCIF